MREGVEHEVLDVGGWGWTWGMGLPWKRIDVSASCRSVKRTRWSPGRPIAPRASASRPATRASVLSLSAHASPEANVRLLWYCVYFAIFTENNS